MSLEKNLNEFLPVLENMFGTNMARLYEIPPIRGEGVLLMGCPVWGEKYLNRFQSYCLPSILAEKNLKALAGRCHMVLFTDADSFTRLESLVEDLEWSAGITLQLLLIPSEVMAHLPRGAAASGDPRDLNKYWILGVCGAVMLKMAKRAGMAVHMLQPDHIYADTYFENLWRLVAAGHEAITQPGISAEIATAWEDIEAYRVKDGPHRGTLPIPGVDLGTIGWKHLHKQTKASLMNGAVIPDQMPHSHLLVWQGRDKLVIHSCHMNPAYLSPQLVRMAPTRIPATLDAELPALTNGARFYVPQIGDGMMYLEVSDKDKGAKEEFVDFETFSERWWTHVRYLFDWLDYSKTPYEVPIKRQRKFIPDDEIKSQFDDILARLIADNPPGAARRFIPRLSYKA